MQQWPVGEVSSSRRDEAPSGWMEHHHQMMNEQGANREWYPAQQQASRHYGVPVPYHEPAPTRSHASPPYPHHSPHEARGASAGSSSASSFHPYASPKPRPLLFINAVPPTGANASGGVDPSVPTKPKRKKIQPDQFDSLIALFEVTDSPSFDAREKVANAVGMTNREVQVWFQNRRAKVNRQRAAAIAPKETKEFTMPAREPLPLSSFTSRFSATVEEPNAGEHAWRYRHTTTVVHKSPEVDEAAVTSFRIPSKPSRPSPNAASGPLPTLPPTSPLPPPSQRMSHHRQVFQGRKIDIPEYSSFTQSMQSRSPSSPYRSPTFPGYSPNSYTSPYLGMPSPSLSSSYGGSLVFGTPNVDSPHSTSASSYFSHADGPYSPTTFSSPTGTFFRLSLDSPGGSSCPPTSASPRTGQFPDRHSPTLSDPPIHLPPIVSPGLWSRPSFREADEQRPSAESRPPPATRPAHHRSVSEGHITTRTLAPLRGLVDVDSQGGDLASSAASGDASPSTSSTRYGSSHSSRVQDRHRRKPSSLSNILPINPEEEEPMSEGSSGGFTEGEALGLGMLAVASERALVEDEKMARYVATRKLSYAGLHEKAAAQATATATASGRLRDDEEMSGV